MGRVAERQDAIYEEGSTIARIRVYVVTSQDLGDVDVDRGVSSSDDVDDDEEQQLAGTMCIVGLSPCFRALP